MTLRQPDIEKEKRGVRLSETNVSNDYKNYKLP